MGIELNLKRRLKQSGVTQEQFAHEMGCSFSFINNVLNGKHKDIKISTLRKIHKLTGFSYEELIDGFLKRGRTDTKSSDMA